MGMESPSRRKGHSLVFPAATLKHRERQGQPRKGAGRKGSGSQNLLEPQLWAPSHLQPVQLL